MKGKSRVTDRLDKHAKESSSKADSPVIYRDRDSRDRYLRGTDLPTLKEGPPRKWTIKSFELNAVPDRNNPNKEEWRDALQFQETYKEMVVREPISTPLIEAHGKNMKKWIGKRIEAFAELTKFGRGVRIRIPDEVEDDEYDDDVDEDDFEGKKASLRERVIRELPELMKLYIPCKNVKRKYGIETETILRRISDGDLKAWRRGDSIYLLRKELDEKYKGRKK